MTVRNFRDLIAWQKAMDLVEAVYKTVQQFPNDERFGLTSQLRLAAVSIPSNIAEGQGRSSTKEFLHHLSIAYGSLCEVQTQILITQRLDYLNTAQTGHLIEMSFEVARLINGLCNSLNKQP